MKTFLLFVSLAVIATCAFPQGATVILHNHGFPLTTYCMGETGIPDGTTIYILQDRDADGPDLQDSLVTVCDHPPDCFDGPVGTFNMNHFHVNSAEMGLPAGEFVSSPALVCVGNTLPDSPRLYLQVCDPNSNYWESTVFTVFSGLSEFDITDWNCGFGGALQNCHAAPGPQVVIRVDSLHAYLTWPWRFGSPMLHYEVYCDSLANGPFSTLLGETADTTYVDSNAVSSYRSRFYRVKYIDPEW